MNYCSQLDSVVVGEPVMELIRCSRVQRKAGWRPQGCMCPGVCMCLNCMCAFLLHLEMLMWLTRLSLCVQGQPSQDLLQRSVPTCGHVLPQQQTALCRQLHADAKWSLYQHNSRPAGPHLRASNLSRHETDNRRAFKAGLCKLQFLAMLTACAHLTVQCVRIA